MRVREGAFAYDVSPVRNPETYLLEHYKVTVSRVHPAEEIIYEETCADLETANATGERQLKKAVAAANRKTA